MQHKVSETLPPCNSIDDASTYVIVEGFHITKPPSRFKPQRRAGCFPLVFSVEFVHPSPCPESTFYNVVRYRTLYEFWLNCDDFSCPERGVATVNRLVDLMNVPFRLHGVRLFWKPFVGNKSGSEDAVANWDSMVAILSEFLQNVKDSVRKQEDDNCDDQYPYAKLQISKFVKLPREETETWLMHRERGRVNGKWHERSFRRPQMQMEWRMAALQAQAIERVKFNGGEAESCGICLTDMSVGSEVARMPCSHYAHETCILKWLRRNNSCPFCRFKIVAIEGKTRPTPDNYWLSPL